MSKSLILAQKKSEKCGKFQIMRKMPNYAIKVPHPTYMDISYGAGWYTLPGSPQSNGSFGLLLQLWDMTGIKPGSLEISHIGRAVPVGVWV